MLVLHILQVYSLESGGSEFVYFVTEHVNLQSIQIFVT